MSDNSKALTPIDGFSDSDPTASPIRGTSIRFREGDYLSFGNEIDVEGKSYAVIDRVQGWQKLAKDTPPEYLMKQPGEPKPLQPHVDKKDWPPGFKGQQPEHPWKWTQYLYLLDTATGEFSTFSSNTKGGHIAVSELSDQVALMRGIRPNAIPIVALKSKDMPTDYGSTKPRPFFDLLGWKERDGESQKLLSMETPSSAEVMKEEDWEQKGDPVPDLDAKPKAKKKTKK